MGDRVGITNWGKDTQTLYEAEVFVKKKSSQSFKELTHFNLKIYED